MKTKKNIEKMILEIETAIKTGDIEDDTEELLEREVSALNWVLNKLV